MKPYRNINGSSGVVLYEIGSDFVRVKFVRDGPVYRYSSARAGKMHVDRMKDLALAGRGLGTYISQNVHGLYDPDEPD